MFDTNTHFAEATHDCGCDALPVQESTVTQLDPRVSASIRYLDEASERYGDLLTEAITSAAIGQGPLAHQIEAVGTGPEATYNSQPGDIIIARGLFDTSDPRIDVVGFDPAMDGSSVLETLGDDERVDVYRLGERDPDALPAVLAGAGRVLAGVAAGGSAANSVLSTLNSAADLRLKYEKIAEINLKNRQPSFKSEVVSLIDPRFRTGNEQTSVYRFTVRGKRRGTIWDSADYVAKFDVTVLHDCINVLEARVTSRDDESRGLLMKYLMSVDITKSTFSGHRLPPMARMHISVNWNPDRLSDALPGYDRGYRATAELQIRADGSVRVVPNVTNREVQITSATRIRRGSSQCRGLYSSMGSGGGGSTQHITHRPSHRPSLPSTPSTPSRRGPRSGTRPHPQHGRNIFFGFASSNPRGYAVDEVTDWWRKLPHAVKASIIRGDRTVYVTGHADYNGSDSSNLRLSNQRANFVADIIGTVTGGQLPKSRLRIDGHGWRTARDSGQRRGSRNQNWRRVTISLDAPG